MDSIDAPPTPATPPDAIMLPDRYKRGTRLVTRVTSVADVADPILGVDAAKGERAYIRAQKPNKLFITKSIHDSINFPTWCDNAGQPRYHWVLQPDGSEYGYLVEGATRGGEPRD